MSSASLPAMLEGDGGSIVHVASESARLPAVFNPDYAAAKLAVLSMSKALATEFTPIRPPLTGRIGQPDDVARVIAYLLSPLSSQVTGAEWVVDGGALPQI
jgi:NAD(P)-dependent dehydrogenase (short-subunit alcohol dehydrogenase family)